MQELWQNSYSDLSDPFQCVSDFFFCYLRPNFSDTNKIVRLFWRKKSKKLTNKKVGSLCIKPASEMIKKGTLKKRKKGRVTLNKNRVLLFEELIFSPKNRAIFEIWKKGLHKLLLWGAFSAKFTFFILVLLTILITQDRFNSVSGPFEIEQSSVAISSQCRLPCFAARDVVIGEKKI